MAEPETTTICSICDDTEWFYSTAADARYRCPECSRLWLGARPRPLMVWDGERMVEVSPTWHATRGFAERRAAAIGLTMESLEL